MTSLATVNDSLAASDETGLILSARNGDLEAFNRLVLSYQDRVYNLAARILGDADAAEDITQNTFLTAFLNLPRFRNGSFRSWLLRIATNACYDQYRQYQRHPVMSIETNELAEENMLPVDDFSSPVAMPEMDIERRELARLVQHALSQLDLDQRAVVILVDQQEFDYQEAAQILGLPIGTVKSRLSRARLRLRQLLGGKLDNLR